MKKYIILTIVCLMTTMTMTSQTYTGLWKQVEEAEKKDLPQTQISILRQIAAKAEAEKAYGQLLKAQLLEAKRQSEIAPDSLQPAVDRLKAYEAKATDKVLCAIYNTVLGYIYLNNRELDIDNYQTLSTAYYDKAMSHPEALAAVKTSGYEPFVVKGKDSRFFGDDLLSVIGYETGRYATLRDYYLKSGNRRAALFTSLKVLRNERPREQESLNKSVYLQRIDSLIAVYSDLTECGEAAIERYDYMEKHTDATAEQKWQYINRALDRWGSWQRMNVLRNSQRDLTALQYNAEIKERVTIPGHDQQVELTELRGINQFIMRLYKVKVNGDTDLNPSNDDDYRKIKPLLTPMPEYTVIRNYVGKKEYDLYDDSITLKGLPIGVYMVEFDSQPSTEVSRSFYYVSNLRVMTQELPEKQIRYVVVNATTGQPVKGAQLRLKGGWGKQAFTTTVSTDANGEYRLKYQNHQPNEMWVSTAEDKACCDMNGTGYFNYNDRVNTSHQTVVYTDRQIYRPGQTVHVAAIAYLTEKGFEHQVEAGKDMHLIVRDANYQTIVDRHLTTDDYGTCATDFTLPTDALNGTFSISVNNEYHAIRVEEYKRPTFEVEFPKVNQHYEDGDTVVVQATARSYAGVPVQYARVKYKVVRRQAFWWFNYSRYWSAGVIGRSSANEELVTGEAVTDVDGHFTVEIPMVVPKTKYPMFYNFVVTADVTDVAGETHQGQMTLPLGNRKTAFSTTMPEKVLAEKTPQVMFNLRNAAGIDIAAKLRYRIDNGKWQDAETNALLTPLSSFLSSMKSGQHTLEAICEEDTLKQEFTIFSLDDSRPATKTDDWFYVSDSQFPSDGSPVTVQVGSSLKDVHIVYNVLAGNKVLETGFVDRSNELINRKFTYQEEYGNGVLLCFAWVKNGKTYTHSTTIRRPLPNKKLQMKWQTFRNRLTPGQQEEWTLTITAPDGKPANAQLMATLYDKSLDQLAAHEWSLTPYMWLPTPNSNWRYHNWGEIWAEGYHRQSMLNVNGLNFSYINHDLYPRMQYKIHIRGRRAGHANILYKTNAMAAVEEMADAAPMVAEAQVVAYGRQEKAMMTGSVRSDADMEEAKEVAEDESTQAEGIAEVQMRENLNETAFFYPQLTTDSLGQVAMKFTLPECLTTWRFLSVAHTKDMMYGTLSDEVVAKKDVMIQPNMPRFVRMGDKATVSARIFNTGLKAISGTARLQLIDPTTERVVAQSSMPVSIQPDSTVSVTFSCEPKDDWSALLIAKMMVSGRDFSDGEQHYLPVLPHRERVTVTVPFTQNEPGTKVIDLQTLLPKDTPKAELTIEYTNNPAWLMVQALPTVGSPCDDNAISQAASLYANGIGRHILKQNPQVKHVFEAWKREQGNETSLMSNLQKDTELKDLLLNETPWVMDANNEQEQKQRLADFFDENLMNQRLNSAIDKLKRLQLDDGSWSWWKGMKGSMYMTVAISEMLVRLNAMTSHNSDIDEMLANAFTFMGNDILKMVQEMKKEEKKGHRQTFPSFKALQWLYICTISDQPLSMQVIEANNYLKALLKKETRNQSIYEKAMSAIVLNSKTYIKSLKEYTVYKEEMGRYYDTPRAGYSWRDYRIPTQVAAIEALQRLTPDDRKTISEMQRWLLQEKRTQAWDMPINSVDAIYAFLNNQSNQNNQNNQSNQSNQSTLNNLNNLSTPISRHTVLKIDGKAIDTPAATAGLGYVKTAMPANDAKTFTAEKTSTGTSWGAVYAQFMQHTSDIKDQKSGISVKREIFAPQNKAQSSKLKVGDRVTVRLTIEADRDYDFVQVVDKRAACMEPVNQLSGYHWGYYISPKDYTTNYYFDVLPKGKHIIETEYYIDRAGQYETGTCTAECAYSPEFRGLTKSQTITVE